jgi:hypothetical protein
MKASIIMMMVVSVALLSSCTNSLDREEFFQWMRNEKNGLHIVQSSGDYKFDVQFEPSNYVALRQHAESPGQAVGDVLKEAQNLQYFTLTVGLVNQEGDFLDHNVSNLSQKQQMLYYYSYQFQDDIKLEDEGTTLPCVLYHFERSADVKNSRTFVMAFENPHKDSKEVKLVIQSPVFGAVPVGITISKNNIPSLKI